MIDGCLYKLTIKDCSHQDTQSKKLIDALPVTYPVDNPIWGCTNSCDFLVDTVNIAEAMAGSHIVEPE